MEMRAKGEIIRGEDVTPEILPLAFALSETFLSSHCSTCFLPLPNAQTTLHNLNNPTPIPIPYLACAAHPTTPLLYCSLPCRDADADSHRLSADCHLLQLHPSTCPPVSLADLRASLRLLLSFETLGCFPVRCSRVAGLMTNGEKFAGDEEILAGIRDGGRAMAAARRMRDGALGFGMEEEDEEDEENEAEEEEAVLGIVLTNAVEVQVSDGRVVGTAVYGPRFSWFNHSCRPNACYRFALGRSDGCAFGESGFRVFAAAAAGEEEDTLKTWISDERMLDHVSCKYGPRVFVRSIQPTSKGEEVCIAYLDVLQPKASRQSELWSKYGFICCCDRCTARPPTYVDLCLQETLDSLKASWSCLDDNFYGSEAYKELTDCLDQAIDDAAEGNPKACCERLEKMLAENFQYQQPAVQLLPVFKLQPLHHLSLNAYITLSSAYRIRASSILALDADNQDVALDAFELNRAAAAYSLLLAGATHHLFSFDSSLIASAAHFWVGAGKSLLLLLGSPTRSSTIMKSFDDHSSLLIWSSSCNEQMPLNDSRWDRDGDHSSHTHEESIIALQGFNATCKGFLNCILRISLKVWPFLIDSLLCLKDIKSPVDFRWLGIDTRQMVETQITLSGSAIGLCSQNEDGCRHRLEAEIRIEGEEGKGVFQLAAHSLLYGRYLARICYGPDYYLTD